MDKKPIGTTGLAVTDICFGTSGLGSMPDTYGYEVAAETAYKTIHAIFDGPVNFLDCARNYASGRSEQRIGAVIRERGGIPPGFVVSTKLDRHLETTKFDAAQARRSFEESLEALSLDRIQMLHLHDPEHAADLSEVTRKGGAIDELFKLKEEGLADAAGLAMGNVDLTIALVQEYPFDVIISHNRYSLLNREAEQLFDIANSAGIAILNAAPFASGILAKGSAVTQKVTYQEGSEEDLAQVRAIEAVCAEYAIAPGAAALQYSMRDPRIASTIVGISKPERITDTLNWANAEIPDEAWAALAALSYSTQDPEANREWSPG
jgi:D-threo-aldose 1-dehydrogenase